MIELGLVRGLITLAVFSLFIGIAFWSYSKRRVDDFNEASQLPLMEDEDAGMRSDLAMEERS